MTTRFLAYLLLYGAFVSGCTRSTPGRSKDQAHGIEAISQIEPQLEPLAGPGVSVRTGRPVASQGDCAPKYAIEGLHGTCVNGQPCRGFGIASEEGQPLCACYGRIGGCSKSERCDPLRGACVPESLPGWGRAPAD